MCPTLCNPMDCSPPDSPVHGMSQARILEWDAISFSRASSQPRDRTCISCIFCIGRRILNHWATWEASHVSMFRWWCLIFIPRTRQIFFFFGCTMKLGNLSSPLRDQSPLQGKREALTTGWRGKPPGRFYYTTVKCTLHFYISQPLSGPISFSPFAN